MDTLRTMKVQRPIHVAERIVGGCDVMPVVHLDPRRDTLGQLLNQPVLALHNA